VFLVEHRERLLSDFALNFSYARTSEFSHKNDPQ
jgi:hypothetical protein